MLLSGPTESPPNAETSEGLSACEVMLREVGGFVGLTPTILSTEVTVPQMNLGLGVIAESNENPPLQLEGILENAYVPTPVVVSIVVIIPSEPYKTPLLLKSIPVTAEP